MVWKEKNRFQLMNLWKIWAWHQCTVCHHFSRECDNLSLTSVSFDNYNTVYFYIKYIIFFAMKIHYAHLVWSINLEFVEETVWLAGRDILLDNRVGCLAFLMDWPVYQIRKKTLFSSFDISRWPRFRKRF